MIEIKNIVFTKKLSFIKHFLCFINHLLPLRLKFASETFIVLIDKNIKGEITLEKDSKSTTRFKITKLILEEYSIAHQLTSYVISRYRAMGANSFYAVVDEKQADLLNIFKNELSFRSCGNEYLYKINDMNTSYSMFLKTLKPENIKDVCAFYNESINSFNRFLFGRENYQFQNPCMRYAFYNEAKSEVLGYFEVATKNNLDYYINFCIDCAYNIYLLDAMKFIYSKIKRKNKNFNLYIKVKDYFMNSKELIAILNENNAEFISKSQILAKDYYREIKENNILKNAKIIFNDPTTA
ncbi:MAG: hypothetical protein IJ877_00075 [Candidatus Gastranaerophilales bacterium]|nr:hypothetical protein [Candidatus Gastranaerophilales bacterium]